jgi:uncharacterized protein (UPF0303 family)
VPADAQSSNDAELIATLEDQQRRLQLARFDNDDAWALGCLFVDVARERGLPIVIDIRRNAMLLFHAALPGTSPANGSWVERKVRVVNRFNESSFLVGRRLAADNATLDREMDVDPIDYAAHGGAFPITITGVGVVGSITVSGLPQAEDHALVVELLERFTAHPRKDPHGSTR